MTVRVAILTGAPRGLASRCLPALVDHPNIEIAAIIHPQRQFVNRRRKLRRDLKKIRRIGLGGAAVGYYMRRWFKAEPAQHLEELAAQHGIPFECSPLTNGRETVRLLKAADVDLALSLSNGVLFPKVFNTPRYGTINVHGELLPEFRGAASVIWNIYTGTMETGFTIHQVDQNLDTGLILYQERFPIEFRPNLAATVNHNCRRITERIPLALANVVANYHEICASAKPQGPGHSYTTPTLQQFAAMVAQHRKLARQSQSYLR